MTTIQGTGNTGKVVLDNQELATKEGFEHVSKIWYNKTLSYEQGLEQLEKDVDNREDILCSIFDMEPIVNADGKLALKHSDGREFELTEWACKQLADRIFMPSGVMKWLTQDCFKPNGTLRFKRDEVDTLILTRNIKNGMRRVDPDKKFRFRTYNDNSLRAVLTTQYAPIDNRWYLEVIKELVPSGRLSHWRGDADTIFGNVLIPDTIRKEKDSDYGGMFSLANCEIGKRKLGQCPSVFMAICMNGCIWDQTHGNVFKQVHKGKLDLFDLKKRIITNVNDQIPLLHDGIDRLLATMEFTVDDTKIKNAFAQIAIENQFNTRETIECVSQFHRHEKAHRNLFGLISAVTRAGQVLKNDRWLAFDQVGGKLADYSDNNWKSFRNRANDLTDEQLVKVYGEAVKIA